MDQVACPVCGGLDIKPIVYGYPGVEAWIDDRLDEVEMGGCLVSGDEPDHRCRACGHAWRGDGRPSRPAHPDELGPDERDAVAIAAYLTGYPWVDPSAHDRDRYATDNGAAWDLLPEPPDWLARHLPDGWDPSLLDSPRARSLRLHGSGTGSSRRGGAPRCDVCLCN